MWEKGHGIAGRQQLCVVPELRLYCHKSNSWLSDPPTRDFADKREQRNLIVSLLSASEYWCGEAKVQGYRALLSLNTCSVRPIRRNLDTQSKNTSISRVTAEKTNQKWFHLISACPTHLLVLLWSLIWALPQNINQVLGKITGPAAVIRDWMRHDSALVEVRTAWARLSHPLLWWWHPAGWSLVSFLTLSFQML